MYAYMKKNEKKVQFRRQLLVVVAGVFVAVCLFLVGGSHLRSHQVQANSATVVETYYTSIYVQSGDTLWDIADAYMDDSYADKNAYIDEVKEINHITESSLQAGSYIIVPYTVTITE